MGRLNKFSESVIKELKYYVYRLIDPRNGETFYVGKGKGNRVFHHVNSHTQLEPDEDEDEISLKISRIRDIKKTELEIIHIIHRHGLDEKTAYEVEAALIDVYPSATNIYGGKGNDFGSMNAFEIEMRYMKEEAIFGNDKIIMISINRTAGEREVYDAVRFAWRLDPKRAKKCDYVLAVEKGLIIGVFIADQWKKATRNNFEGFSSYPSKRYGFVGYDAPEDIRKNYIQKRVPDIYRKKGASNPIKYNY